MQLSLSCLCFIIPDFWHKAHTNEGEKQRKDNTIKHQGAVRLDLKQPSLNVRPQLRRTFTKYLMADAYAWACMENTKISMIFWEPYCLVFALLHIRELQSCPTTPYGRSQLWEASQHVQAAAPPLERVSHSWRARSTRHLLEKASAHWHWLKRQLLFIRTNLRFHKP